MKDNPGVNLGLRVDPCLKEALMRQAKSERRTLRAVCEPILEKALQTLTQPEARG